MGSYYFSFKHELGIVFGLAEVAGQGQYLSQDYDSMPGSSLSLFTAIFSLPPKKSKANRAKLNINISSL